jgi:hypothetical protein
MLLDLTLESVRHKYQNVNRYYSGGVKNEPKNGNSNKKRNIKECHEM